MQPERERHEPAPGSQRLRPLRVGGVVPFTATDYPGRLAAVVFVQGCPWRCGYCHNPHLQPRTQSGAMSWASVMDLLERRVGLIDGVVFSGGEPTADPSLADAILDVRKLGYQVGLHSAGTHPQRLRAILPLLDWVGLDIKAPFDRYTHVTRRQRSGEHALASLEAVLASGVDYECRTTAHPELLPEDELLRLARRLSEANVKRYALQVFRPHGCDDGALNAASLVGYPKEAVVAEIGALFPRFTLRRA